MPIRTDGEFINDLSRQSQAPIVRNLLTPTNFEVASAAPSQRSGANKTVVVKLDRNAQEDLSPVIESKRYSFRRVHYMAPNLADRITVISAPAVGDVPTVSEVESWMISLGLAVPNSISVDYGQVEEGLLTVTALPNNPYVVGSVTAPIGGSEQVVLGGQWTGTRLIGDNSVTEIEAGGELQQIPITALWFTPEAGRRYTFSVGPSVFFGELVIAFDSGLTRTIDDLFNLGSASELVMLSGQNHNFVINRITGSAFVGGLGFKVTDVGFIHVDVTEAGLYFSIEGGSDFVNIGDPGSETFFAPAQFTELMIAFLPSSESLGFVVTDVPPPVFEQ